MISGLVIHRRLVLSAVLAVALAPAGAQAASSSGSAETTNTVLSLSIAGTETAIGSDSAQAIRGSQRHARAAFTAGRSAETTTGELERTGSSAEDSGSDDLGEGELSLAGLVRLDVVEASAAVELTDAHVTSQADATLASVALLDGLVSLEGLVSQTAAEVTEDASEASRTIVLDGLQVFDLAGLLDALGVDRLAVPCAGVEGAAAALGVDADQVCEQLAAAEAALAGARTDLDDIAGVLDAIVQGHDRAEGEADRATAAALSCGALDVVCIAAALATLADLATAYDVILSNPTDLTSSRSEILAALDELLAAHDDHGVIGDAIEAAGSGTCDGTADALADAEDQLSADDPADAAPVLAVARTETEVTCSDLRSTTDEVMGTPVMTMDDVTITLSARAADGDTSADVAVSIGVVRIGLNDAAAIADLAAGLDQADAIAEAIASVVEGLMIGATTPEIELFAVETQDGQDLDGEWFADASLAVLQITQPAGSLTVPDDPPFAVLGDGVDPLAAGGAAGPMLGAAPRALLAAIVDAPPIVVRAVVFDASAGFTPASSDGGDEGSDSGGQDDGDDGSPGPGGGVTDQGDALPVTGTAEQLLTFLAALMLVGAGGVRRWLTAA